MTGAMPERHALPHAVHRDYTGSKIAMWLFLFTEILLFGGLFLLYSAYRAKYPHEFHDGGNELNVVIGVINTLVLLTSSLSMAASITALQKGSRRFAMLLVGVTVAFGGVFLMNKYFEWMVKIHHGLYPNGPELLKRPPGEILFFGLYFTMTGLHGLHVLAGMIVLSIMLVMMARNSIRADNYGKLENAGLYWHLVDVIWIFLLNLFYLAA
jgi:cytochrome c oxidase subunit 3